MTTSTRLESPQVRLKVGDLVRACATYYDDRARRDEGRRPLAMTGPAFSIVRGVTGNTVVVTELPSGQTDTASVQELCPLERCACPDCG